TGSDLCSVFGPFTGANYCAPDPAASTSQTITVPAAPSTPPPTRGAPSPAPPPAPAASNAFTVTSPVVSSAGAITLGVSENGPGTLSGIATFVETTKKTTGKGHRRHTHITHTTVTYG